MVVRPADCSRQNVARRGGADDKQRGPAAAALTSRDSGRARSAGGPQCIPRLNDTRKEKRVNNSRNAGTQRSWVLPRHSPALARAQRAPSNRRVSRFAHPPSHCCSPFAHKDAGRRHHLSTRRKRTCCTARTLHDALFSTLFAAETLKRIPLAGTHPACTTAPSHLPWSVQKRHVCSPT